MIDVTMTDSRFAPEEVLVYAELYYGMLIGALLASVIWCIILNFNKNEDINELSL